jgi:hypothetical protein
MKLRNIQKAILKELQSKKENNGGFLSYNYIKRCVSLHIGRKFFYYGFSHAFKSSVRFLSINGLIEDNIHSLKLTGEGEEIAKRIRG